MTVPESGSSSFGRVPAGCCHGIWGEGWEDVGEGFFEHRIGPVCFGEEAGVCSGVVGGSSVGFEKVAEVAAVAIGVGYMSVALAEADVQAFVGRGRLGVSRRAERWGVFVIL